MPFVPSYKPSYFSIDDILTTQERVPCKFLMEVPKLGKLNPAAETEAISQGSNLELPVWLVNSLSSGRQPIVSLELPKVYRDAYREILKADPCAVDLHKFNLHYYELGEYMKQIDHRGDLNQILMHTFQTRFRKLIDLTESVGTIEPKELDRLDITERKLFYAGHVERLKLNAYLTKTLIPLEAANLVVNHKKRKRICLDDSVS